jgi:tetratricopeptide (TPR) repeat protein
MLIYMVFSILYLNNKVKYTYVPSIAFGIWLSLHYLAAVFFPSFIILLIYGFRKNKIQASLSVVIFAICFASGFLVTGLEFNELIKRFISPNESHWLPIITNNKNIIPVLSFSHLWNVINVHLLILPFGFIFLVAFLTIFIKNIEWKKPPVVFLSVIAFFSAAFILFFNSYLGLAKDWDVAALMGFPLLFLLIYLIITMFDVQLIKTTLLSMSYLCFCQSMVWVILNWNVNLSEHRNTRLDNEYLWEKDKLAIYNEELGAYFRNKGDLRMAAEKYIRGLKYAPNSERLILSLSNIYQKENDYAEAESLIDSAIKNGDNSRKMVIEFGVINMREGKYEQALKIFKEIIEKNPSDIEVLGNISLCYYSLKDYPESIDYSNLIIIQNPSFPLPYIGIGDCYLSMGDTITAKQNYLKANNMDKEQEYKYIIEERMKNIRN